MADGLSAGGLDRAFEDGLSARALLSSIRRHLAVVLACTLSLCTMGALVGLGLPAWYEAKGVLVIRSVPQRIRRRFKNSPTPLPILFSFKAKLTSSNHDR